MDSNFERISKGKQYNSNLSLQIIDATYVKSIYGEDCIGKNPTDGGRNATKVSILVDKKGSPTSYVIAEGNINDNALFEKTLANAKLKSNKKPLLLADKDYSSSKNKEIAAQYKFNLIAPNKRNFKKPIFKKNKKIKLRYKVEACNSWIKQFRELRLRYCKLISSYESFLLLSFSIISFRKMASF